MSRATQRSARSRPDRAVAAVVLAFAAATYAYTYTFDEVPAALMSGMGAELFPRLVLGTLALLAVLLAYNVGSPPMDAPQPIPREVWITAAGLLAFVGILEVAGMWPACIATLVGLGWLWGERNLMKLSASALALVGALYLLFVRVLGVSFPKGLLGALIWR
jgi:hypothetical protein